MVLLAGRGVLELSYRSILFTSLWWGYMYILTTLQVNTLTNTLLKQHYTADYKADEAQNSIQVGHH